MTFDLKAARDALSRATERANVATDIYHLAALTYLPAALDEIEQQAKCIAELQDDIKQLSATVADSDAVVIIRSKEDLAIIAKQRAALKKLGQAKRERGKALVEERISGEFSDWIENQCPHWDIDVEPFCVALDGPCEYREGKCPIRNELLDRAREQLRQEGKI